MRILFVAPYVPSRIRVRSFNLIKLLSKKHDIALVSLIVDDYERAMVGDIEQYCVSVDLVPLPKRQAYANCLMALPSLMPLRAAYYRSSAFAQRIKEVIHREHIDVVHGELIKVVPALKAALADERIPVLYDAVDCISWYLQQQMDTTRHLLKKAFVFSELWKMRRYEGKALLDFEQLIISSASDRDRLQGLTGQSNKIAVVSNCVDTDYFTPWPAPQNSDSLVFCAKLDYFPNTQAVLHFCENILPLVWQQRPQVRLTIVGNNPPKSVRALAVDRRIAVTDFVPDVRPYLGPASVALAPLMVAAGTQFKVLEALSMGVPTVTTPKCARALDAEDGVHLLVAEEPRAFADAIVRLLNSPSLAGQLGKAGRRFVIDRYSWVGAVNDLNRLYDVITLASGQLEPAAMSAIIKT